MAPKKEYMLKNYIKVLSVVNERRDMQKISFVAHSLGGLITRYTIGKLYESSNRFSPPVATNGLKEDGNWEGTRAGLEAMNFITFTSPHLGLRGHKQHDTSDDDVQLMFTVSSSSLDVCRFGGLFLITGTISISSIMLYIGIFIRKEFNVVDGRGSIWDKMAAWARHYDGFKDDSSKNKRRDQKLSYEDAVNTHDSLLHLSGHLGKSDVSAANFASPERVVVSGSCDKHNSVC